MTEILARCRVDNDPFVVVITLTRHDGAEAFNLASRAWAGNPSYTFGDTTTEQDFTGEVWTVNELSVTGTAKKTVHLDPSLARADYEQRRNALGGEEVPVRPLSGS